MSQHLRRHIGLLTGTFDPVHLGHMELAKAAMRAVGLDEIWLMVNPKQVDSPVERKDGVAAYEHRLAMAELAAQEVNGISVYDGVLAGWPHTMQTFRELMQQNPEIGFVFVLGMDTISRLDGWDDFESVVNNASFAVAQRRGVTPGAVDDLRRRLGDLGEKLDVQLFDFDDHGAATSREIRRQLQAGERPESLDGQVRQYIGDYDLYR